MFYSETKNTPSVKARSSTTHLWNIFSHSVCPIPSVITCRSRNTHSPNCQSPVTSVFYGIIPLSYLFLLLSLWLLFRPCPIQPLALLVSSQPQVHDESLLRWQQRKREAKDESAWCDGWLCQCWWCSQDGCSGLNGNKTHWCPTSWGSWFPVMAKFFSSQSSHFSSSSVRHVLHLSIFQFYWSKCTSRSAS